MACWSGLDLYGLMVGFCTYDNELSWSIIDGEVLKSFTPKRYGQLAGTCECGNEPSGSIKCGEFLD
jgi:hypothetical protein